MGTRREGREAAVQMLYQMDLSGVDAEQAIVLYRDPLTAGADEDLADDDLPVLGQGGAARRFAEELVRGVASARERIDETIRGASRHWRLERMARVDRNVLRLAVYELLQRDDIPPNVTLNEAVELAKRYGDEGSRAFVNGILDRVAADQGNGRRS
ncbi:MAG: transcription antitermination factor NusB [Myxococcales bacterium]|jgi:N utilization substance protein B